MPAAHPGLPHPTDLPPLRASAGSQVRVVIVGGGFAAAEALIALRALAGARVRLAMVTDRRQLALRPLAVAAPFGMDAPDEVSLSELCADHDATLHHGHVTFVDITHRVVETDQRERIGYDALIVATGAQTRASVAGALRFDGIRGIGEMRALLESAETGAFANIVFAVPAGVTWALPAYELALMTAERTRDRAKLTIVTPEAVPLELFGRPAGDRLATLLAEHGIELLTGSAPDRVVPAGLLTSRGLVPADRVVALPQIEGPRIPGLPADPDGFLVVDGHGRVDGTTSVYAAGDVTAFPVKQGGLATQQADAVARAIAARAGAPVEPEPFRPVLRALLLTGSLPLFIRGPGDAGAAASHAALWRPVGKVVARYLGPWLVDREHARLGAAAPFADHPQPAREDDAGHQAAVELALALADDEAASGGAARAIEWLDAVESLEGALPPGYAERRRRWAEQVTAGRRLTRTPGESW
jgi:sulfide:quinone oxidoreductase